MAQAFQRWRRASSASTQQQLQQQLPFTNGTVEEDGSFEDESASERPSSNLIRAKSSTSGTSRTPLRSFFHQASHGSTDPAQYSSLGVREETGELASFAFREPNRRTGTPLLRDDLNSRDASFAYKQQEASRGSGQGSIHARRDLTLPDAIIEVSEPATSDAASQILKTSTPTTSALTDLLRRSSATSSASGTYSQDKAGQVKPDNESYPTVVIDDSDAEDPTETSPLLGKSPSLEPHYVDIGDLESQATQRRGSSGARAQRVGSLDRLRAAPAKALESIRQAPGRTLKRIRRNTAPVVHAGTRFIRTATNPKSWDKRTIYDEALKKPVRAVPAVVLGSMLNLLDGMSYGLVLFPLNYKVFAKTGPDGISMFFVSTIVSQLVFTLGFSTFKCGVGSEMIEIIPFCHHMATTIMHTVSGGDDETILCTTQVAFAMSAFLTGLLFWLLGHFKCGNVVNYFPRHILIGSIAGVGLFLLKTGIEVSSPLDEISYDLETLRRLLAGFTILLWLLPLLLAIFLRTAKGFIKSAFLDPAFFIAITAIFYIIVAAVPQFTVDSAREAGWIFSKTDSDVPFYNFYLHYSWSKIDWKAIGLCVPTMIAVTFFGLLHVPINVPALALRVGEDDLDMNRELKAHGVSNCASGIAGSVQNYLVYANSDMVYRNGGNCRQAGFMIAVASFGLWVAGPGLIGFVPKPTVGALIYLLGLDLTIESVWETYGSMDVLEWLSVVAMMLVMGLYDFVYGIILGLVLACLTIVIHNSRKSSIRATYTGAVAQSTVRRHITQRRFLREAGDQTYVVKLAMFLFFGTIVDVENKIRALLDGEDFAERPIRYLIFDFKHVTGMDYSAAEAFERMKRLLDRRQIHMVLSGLGEDDDVGLAFQRVGLWTEGSDVAIFKTLNEALEMCENQFLKALYQRQDALAEDNSPKPLPFDGPGSVTVPKDNSFHSPRRRHLHEAATTTLTDRSTISPSKWQAFAQPLPLMLQAFAGITTKNEDFWHPVAKYFRRRRYTIGTTLFSHGEPATGFYLLEEGTLRAVYSLPQGNFHESIVMGTTCGELPFFSETERTATVTAETDCVAWVLTVNEWKKMQKEHPEAAQELLRISLKLTTERMKAIVSYVLMTS